MGEYTQGCCGCAHSETALLERIAELTAEYKGKEGSLIQVLHMAQGIYGYLPLEVQEVIADGPGYTFGRGIRGRYILLILRHPAKR